MKVLTVKMYENLVKLCNEGCNDCGRGPGSVSGMCTHDRIKEILEIES